MAEHLADDCIVTIAEGAGDALARIARGEAFDLVLCAPILPIVSGIELHRRLGALAPQEAARIVFMTTSFLPAEARAYIERVPNARVKKPIDLNEVRLLVEARLRDSLESAASRGAGG
jgi:CheY-like chemotaxis protein